MNEQLILGLALTATAIVAACNGDVVVDTGPSGAGAGGAPGSSATGAGAAGGSCTENLGPTASHCSAQAGSGTGGVTLCEFAFCDPAANMNWLATCQGNTCQCQEQGGASTLCSCAFPAGTDACATQSNCCYLTQ